MSTTPQFAIPNEMRALAERSVEQAKVAFQQLMQAAEEAVSTLDERSETSQVDALYIAKKAMTFAERNVLSAFELAQKITQTKDIQQLVQMQTEFLQSQMQALGQQVKDLDETVSKAAMNSKKTPPTGGLSS
jgi:phasin